MHDEARVQEEPGGSHRDNHIDRKSTDAVLSVGAAFDEERGDRARRKKNEAAVH